MLIHYTKKGPGTLPWAKSLVAPAGSPVTEIGAVELCARSVAERPFGYGFYAHDVAAAELDGD